MTPNQYKDAKKRLEDLKRKEAVIKHQREEALAVLAEKYPNLTLQEVRTDLQRRSKQLLDNRTRFESKLKEVNDAVTKCYKG